MVRISTDDFPFDAETDDMVIPFGAVKKGENTEITYNPYFEKSVGPLLDADGLFSESGNKKIKNVLLPEAEKLGMVCETVTTDIFEADSSDMINRSVIMDSSEVILSDLAYENLTDIDAEDDSLVYIGTVIDGKIVSMACENPHGEDDTVIDIAVETAEEYRGRGYAASNVAKLAYYILDPGKKVTYICETENKPSFAVAEKAGFKKIGDELRVIFYKEN